MNIKQCESFLKLAETKNFSKSSQELYISKQGLSRTIQSLEDELGTQLFCRTLHGTELSPEGSKILPEMEQIMELYHAIQKKLRNISGNELKILFSFGFFLCISPDVIFDFLERNRAIHFQYTCYSDTDIEKMLLDGDADLAFCSNPTQNKDLNYIHLFRNYRCFLVHKDSPLAQKQFITVPDLNGIKIAVSAPEAYNDYNYLHKKFSVYGQEPDIFPCYESSTLLAFAAEKRGVSFLITSLNRSVPSPDTCYLFFEDYITSAYDVNIITKRGRKLSQHAIGFIHHTKNYCQNLLKYRPNFPMD